MTGRDCLKTRIFYQTTQKTVMTVMAVGFGFLYSSGALLIAETKPETRVAKRITKGSVGDNHKLIPVLKIARKCQEQLKAIKDYEAMFSKREQVGNQFVSQTIQIKLRERPFSVYLKYVNPHLGREVIYVQGKNDGNLLAHGTGIESIVGTLTLSPTSADAMVENRYPITMIGISNMLDKVTKQWDFESQYDEVEVKYYPNAKIGRVACKVVETSHPKRRPHFKFHMTRLYVDQKTNLPIRVEQYGFPKKAGAKPPLIEQYTYSALRPNMNLTDRDFDPSNSKYDY